MPGGPLAPGAKVARRAILFAVSPQTTTYGNGHWWWDGTSSKRAQDQEREERKRLLKLAEEQGSKERKRLAPALAALRMLSERGVRLPNRRGL